MVSKVDSSEVASWSSTFTSHSSSVAFKREKRANLRKHVRQIRSFNSTTREKIRRYLVIFFSWLKFLHLLTKFSTNRLICGKRGIGIQDWTIAFLGQCNVSRKQHVAVTQQ